MIDAVVARLRANLPELKLIGKAVDFQSAAESNPKATPACFVIPIDETPESNGMGDILIQRVSATIGVVLVVRNLADNKGAAAGADLELLRAKVKRQVFGWTASPELDPFERGNSHLLAFRDGHMWWQDLYRTAYFDKAE
ncbi:phage tail terminator protein [Undibacterium sp. TJN25]|uniref:phage tail terminator protein n=1 Tax=Undibacterium sp. TJN25 TaxID=3413056 RepID=UPI003BF2DACD